MKDLLKPYLFYTHADYLSVLQVLKDKTKYIQIVDIGYGDATQGVIKLAKSCMVCTWQKRVNEWPGTKRSGAGAIQYEFVAQKQFIDKLEKYESFFINTVDKYGGDEVIGTDFGLDDIAFLDGQKELLFYTTTHEGYAFIREDLLLQI